MLGDVAIVLLLTAARQAVAGEQQGVVWKWDSDPAVCTLRQQLGDARSFVEVSRTPGNDQTGIAFIERGSATTWKPFVGATITLEPGGSTTGEGSITKGDLPRSRKVGVSVTEQGFLEEFSRATSLMVSHAAFGSLRASLRHPAAAVQALRDCEDRKMRGWGIDPSAWRALRARPIPLSQPYVWFTTGDYPTLAALYGVGGLVITRLDIAADGTVSDCTIVNRQVLGDFANAACRVLKRNGRFRPAVAANGQATTSHYIARVRFEAGR